MNKKIILIGCIILFLLAFPMKVQAESSLSTDYTNQLTNYVPDIYGECRTSFLGKLSDGGYQAVVYDNGVLYVYYYDSSYRMTETKQVTLELPIWGGLFLGETYNYVVCGNNYDTSQESGGEVYRVIKYDKEFNRLDSVSFGGNQTYTAVPFDVSNVSIDECGELLTVYTGRLRLDGHQSNIIFRINTVDMTIDDSDGYDPFPVEHVSHSFRQIMKYDNGSPVYVDLSDSYPLRAVCLLYEKGGKALLEIPGQDGHNLTNTEVSGLEISDSHLFVVGTFKNQRTNNVYLSSVEKDTGTVNLQWLTNSTEFKKEYIGATVRITGIGNNKYIVMWQSINKVSYVIIDGTGKIVSGVKQKNGVGITDCEPILDQDKVIWLSVKNGQLLFNEITDFSETGKFELIDSIKEAINPWDGTADISWYSDSENEFHITEPEQLAGVALLVNGGNSFIGKTVCLENDIFLNDESYTYDWIPMEGWEGTFNGKGYHIYNMYVPQDSWGGLFGTIGENGVVKALNMSQGIFNSGGCIAHQNKGEITFCNNYSSVNISSDYETGGICNDNWSLVYGCKNYGTVYGEAVGGLVGRNWTSASVVSQCGNLGCVEATHDGAGVVCFNYGEVINCYNRGVLSNSSFKDGLNVGDSLSGIVCENYLYDIKNCYSAGTYIHNNDLKRGPNAIFYENSDYDYENIINCYSLPMEGITALATIVSEEYMKSNQFIEELSGQANAWMKDDNMINDGFPITIADYYAANGIYKVEQLVDISGTIKCFGNEDNETLLELWHSSGFGIKEVALSGNSANYYLDNISEGKYTLQVSRKNHVMREYQFDIGSKSENILQNIELHLTGDITGDGVINARDKKMLFNHIAGTAILEGYDFTVGDVTGDGTLNARDKKMIYNHIAGTSSLWE